MRSCITYTDPPKPVSTQRFGYASTSAMLLRYLSVGRYQILKYIFWINPCVLFPLALLAVCI